MLFEGQEYPYEIVDRERYHIGRIEVIKDTIRIDGVEHPYTFTRTSDSVCVFPVCEDGIVIIEQYRHSLNRWMLEIPAGGIEPDESPAEAARRELLEETGYYADELINMGEYHVNEGISTSCCTLFFARCRKQAEAVPEDTEMIRTKVVSAPEFKALVDQRRFGLLIGLAGWYQAKEKGWI